MKGEQVHGMKGEQATSWLFFFVCSFTLVPSTPLLGGFAVKNRLAVLLFQLLLSTEEESSWKQHARSLLDCLG